ncbi:MAG: hypothetical protein C0390_10190 [Syntrophus sp. (in: bacteria)]|nr:hypothetical protein [Syntrophus sp. (in: bacteria)]
MIFFVIASLLLSLTIGVFMVLLFLPSANRKTIGLLFCFFAGGGLGIGVTSGLYFVCLLTGLTRYAAAIDLVVCLVLGMIYLIRRGPRGLPKQGCIPPGSQLSVHRAGLSGKKDSGAKRDLHVARPARTGSPLQILIAVIFSIELLSSLISFTVAFLKEPHGRWDAWLIWNMHARFLFRGGDHWREAFASGLDWSHWDYPLLLPLSIARGWTYTGGEGNLPAVMGCLFTFLILGLLLTSLFLLRGRIQGYLAAMLLMGTPFFIYMGASQFADIPLAFFILTTLIMLFFQAGSPESRPGAVILAGLAAGLCVWTKNEGQLFFVIVAGSLFCTTAYSKGWDSSLRRTAWFLAGALPILMIVIYFKTALAPTNDLLAGFSVSAASAKLLDPSRYIQIAGAFFVTGISFTQGLIDIRVGMHLNPGPVNVLLLAAYLLITGIHINQRDKTGLLQTTAVLFLMAAGYFFVYVLTPLDLNYHLMTSLNRLFLQLWPGVIFVVFMVAGPSEQAFLPGDGPETVPGQYKPRPSQERKTKKMEAK